MKQLSSEAKEAIVLKAISRDGVTIESIARSNNIGLSSLQKWMSQYRDGKSFKKTSKNKVQAERASQLEHIIATSQLDELSLGRYCREHGLYEHQLSSWREKLMKEPNKETEQNQKVELKKLKAENERLQKELCRKDKALAEVSALLILKKKADLIWGESKDD